MALVTDWLNNGIWFRQIEDTPARAAVAGAAGTDQTQYIIFSINPSTGTFVLSHDGVDSATLVYDVTVSDAIKYRIYEALSVFFGPVGLLENPGSGGSYIASFDVPYGTNVVEIKNNSTDATITTTIHSEGTPAIAPVSAIAATGPSAVVWLPQIT